MTILDSIFGSLSDLHYKVFEHIWKGSSDLVSKMFVSFHWSLLIVLYAAYSTDIFERYHRSVKSSKHFWEQVRKILTGWWNLPNIVEIRSEKTFPPIESRMINLLAELGWISEKLPLSPQLRLGLRAGFHWPTLPLLAGLYHSSFIIY